MRSIIATLGLATLALLQDPGRSVAQGTTTLPTPSCAWQFEWTAFGLGNWLWPSIANRWWYMPVDPQWQTMTMTGAYPKARFFSFAVYGDAPVSTGLADHIFDAQIEPEQGSNPFSDQPDASGGNRINPAGTSAGTYTVTIVRNGKSVGNALHLNAATGWLIYRVYLPNSAGDSMGSVPLPDISITDGSGQTTPLPTCPVVNRQSQLAQLQPQIVPPALENPPAVPPVPDNIWFGPPAEPPPFLLPNPDNKYLVSFFLPEYEPGRMIVVRGKMPAFPDTFRGAPVSQPAPGFDTVQLRYWEMCQADAVSPLPVDGCATDAATPLDGSGFYTVAITNDVLRPDWLPEGVTWLPFGDEKQVPKLIFLRNLLPYSDFNQTAQNAIAQGCGFDFAFPTPPTQDQIRQSVQCTQKVMGDYYPEAVWCDQQAFRSGGWQACFRAAGLPADMRAALEPKAAAQTSR